MQNNLSMKQLLETSPLSGNAQYVEGLFEQYLQDASKVPPKWRAYFDSLPKQETADYSHADVLEEFADILNSKSVGMSGDIAHERKQAKVMELINAFRLDGHLIADIDPILYQPKRDVSELKLEHHGFSKEDLETTFSLESFQNGKSFKLKELYDILLKSYASKVGTEYMHISDEEERRWLQERIEGRCCIPEIDLQQRKDILEMLTNTEGLERYLGAKFPGAKRFSLEGGDALMVIIETLFQRGGALGIKESVIGMAHRGRLNVLVGIMGKKPSDLFHEFEGIHENVKDSGDVKYHQGFSSDIKTPGGNMHITLAFNPSHLEIVAPVVAGSVRVRQDRREDTNREQVMPITIHGDSAVAGQGVVAELYNMSKTPGYGIGGTVHIVVNNQVGFTTSRVCDTRSTLYCSDIAKVVQSPVFHVNADCPEAVLFVSQLAIDYKVKFKKDVMIDLVCYRRHGHNEADEPSVTQPHMYQIIRKHPTVREIYANRLVAEGHIDANYAAQLQEQCRNLLDHGEPIVKGLIQGLKISNPANWKPYFVYDWRTKADTTLDKVTAKQLSDNLLKVPEGFVLHNRVAKIFDDRKKMSEGQLACDWGFAENLAYASLLKEGFPIRISGQDSGRGTFFHRHATVHNQNSSERYTPLEHVDENQAKFNVIDSVLSEEAVLAYEYGYASSDPKVLVIWEAQFGDFANGAQVVIDQFISSGEQKWGRLCGLVMFLPHGYEGMGPEHSSARLERYLQLCAQHNMQVCYPSTPAQVFHMLRRQMIRPIRRPLIVMTPKSLLRHKDATSSLDEILNGSFKPIIGDTLAKDEKAVKRVLLCTGKVYYDLLEKHRTDNRMDVAIVRVEQLYPFPEDELKVELARFKNAKEVYWVQEEPQNQGAWYCSQHHFRACISAEQSLTYAGRDASASPAVGFADIHQKEQEKLVNDAFA